MTEKEKIRKEIKRQISILEQIEKEGNLTEFGSGGLEHLCGILSFIDAMDE